MSPTNETIIPIFINDVTLRDGEQAPGNTMTLEQKVMIGKQLVAMGVNGMEAGFPVSSPKQADKVKAVASEVGTLFIPNTDLHPRISGLARLVWKDIEAVMRSVREAPHRGVHTFISTSQKQLPKLATMIRDAGGNTGSIRDLVDKVILPGLEKHLPRIKAEDPAMKIQFSLEDWTRTSDDVSDQVILAAASNGADVINLPDTVGYGMYPEIVKEVARVRKLLDKNGFQHVVISWHGHNDTGMGVANAMAALHGGATQFEPTILGIGERTGNFSYEGWLAAFDARRKDHEKIASVHRGVPVRFTDTLVRIETMRTAKLLASILGIDISREHPLVGENAFAHASGIHQQAAEMYEIFRPADYGATRKIVIDQNSGWGGINIVFAAHDLPVDPRDRQKFTAALTAAADERIKGLEDSEVLDEVYFRTIMERTGGPRIQRVDDLIALTKELAAQPMSVDVVDRFGTTYTGQASSPSEGRIDATQNALTKIMPGTEFVHLDATSIGEGSGVIARASVTMKNRWTVTSIAEDTNTEKAVEMAQLGAFNKLVALHQYEDMRQSIFHEEDHQEKGAEKGSASVAYPNLDDYSIPQSQEELAAVLKSSAADSPRHDFLHDIEGIVILASKNICLHDLQGLHPDEIDQLWHLTRNDSADVGVDPMQVLQAALQKGSARLKLIITERILGVAAEDLPSIEHPENIYEETQRLNIGSVFTYGLNQFTVLEPFEVIFELQKMSPKFLRARSIPPVCTHCNATVEDWQDEAQLDQARQDALYWVFHGMHFGMDKTFAKYVKLSFISDENSKKNE